MADKSQLGKESLSESRSGRSYLVDKESPKEWEMSYQQDSSSPHCTAQLVDWQLQLGNTHLVGKGCRLTALRGLVPQHSRSHHRSEVALRFRSHSSGLVDKYQLWPSLLRECSLPEWPA